MITHEFIHHLRVEDDRRKGVSKTVYDLDNEGQVIPRSKTYENTFAEECAVIAETEIRTKECTQRPNRYVFELDRQPAVSPSEKIQSIKIERSTMRTKKHAIKSKDTVPMYRTLAGPDVMKDGTNLRGERAMDMFDRNYPRSRLYDAARRKKESKKNH